MESDKEGISKMDVDNSKLIDITPEKNGGVLKEVC